MQKHDNFNQDIIDLTMSPIWTTVAFTSMHFLRSYNCVIIQYFEETRALFVRQYIQLREYGRK